MTLGPPVQIAYAVPSSEDLRSAADDFRSRTGAGPFLIVEHIELQSVTIDGTPSSFDHSSAYGQWGSVMVELVQEHTTPIIGHGLHHLAFMVDSLDATIRACRTSGWPVLLDATTVGGQRFVFCDARASRGHLIELYEPTPTLTAFYARIRSLTADIV
jgi:catechol 2,3-dioxygenase-like lactoylglutathione lyase family enzyme